MNNPYPDIQSSTGKLLSFPDRLHQATFVEETGIEFLQAGEGWCETSLALASRHLRDDGTVHSGPLSLLLEHTPELAGLTLVKSNESVRIVEIKANLLRPARGIKLRCRSQVVRQGSMTLGVGSEIFAHNQRQKTLVARALITLSITDKPLPL
jgi:uncharacterized protein (TIGR00369 family)